MRAIVPVALLTLAAALSSACATARAQAPVEMQPLEVPPVPPRVIVPDIEEIVPEPPAEAAGAPKPASQRTDPPPKPPDTTATEPPRSAEPPRTQEAPRVRTPQTANDEQAERDVRAIMARADGMLNNVPYKSLSPAARQQYDTARRFIAQANNALRIRNYVFARNLADKAETLARQLGK